MLKLLGQLGPQPRSCRELKILNIYHSLTATAGWSTHIPHSTKPASQTTQAGHINLKIFLREHMLRGLKTSLVKKCHLCRAQAEAAEGIVSMSTPLCLPGGNLGFSSASFEFPQLLAGRRHLLPTSECFGLPSSCVSITLLSSSSQHSPLTCDNSWVNL